MHPFLVNPFNLSPLHPFTFHLSPSSKAPLKSVFGVLNLEPEFG